MPPMIIEEPREMANRASLIIATRYIPRARHRRQEGTPGFAQADSSRFPFLPAMHL
jgi:hypothetical protein